MVYGTKNLGTRSQAYELLTLAATEHWGMVSLPPIERALEGKPYFCGMVGWEFNLSHSGTLALCALDDQPVGVDVQVIKEWRPGLPGRVCSSEELVWLDEQLDHWRAFAQLWALKESRVKQSGRGLRDPIRSVTVPLPREGETLYRLDDLWFRLYVGQNWVGAACGLIPPPEEIRWR